MSEPPAHSGVELMEHAPVGRAVIRLALPMMLTMLAQSIYSMADLFFIGQTGDPDMVAAVSLAFPVFMLSQAIGNVFAVGGASYISRMLGMKRLDEAKHASAVSLWVAVGLGVAISVVLWFFKGPILWAVGASPATFGHADQFLAVLIPFVAAGAAGGVMSGQMRSEGATGQAMRLQLIGLALNVVLNPVFILGLGWGTAGSAAATVAGQLASIAYGIHYFTRGRSLLSILPRDFKPSGKMLGQILAIGVPEGVSSLVMGACAVVGNRIAAGYGDYVVAGNGVQMRVTGMVFMLIFGLGLGFQPFAGYNYGAGHLARVRQGFKLTVLYTTILAAVGSALSLLFGEQLVRLFIDDPNTIQVGTAMMRSFAVALPFVGLQITLLVTFQSLGKPIPAMIVTLGRQLIFYLHLLLILSGVFGLDGFIWAQPGSDILTTAIAAILGVSLLKALRSPPPAPDPREDDPSQSRV
jgi:putative MATE family efflux protein